MNVKWYNCQIGTCFRAVGIRSTIKNGEHKGKKVCPSCKAKFDSPAKKKSKVVEARKEQRKPLADYYSYGIKKLSENPHCQNCGRKIIVGLHPINNVAHILSKQKYKSVMANPYNMLFLCDSKDNPDGRSCHTEFDSKVKARPEMPVFNTAILVYSSFKDDVKEWGVEREIME